MQRQSSAYAPACTTAVQASFWRDPGAPHGARKSKGVAKAKPVATAKPERPALSPRDGALLRCAARGLTVEEIAQELRAAPATVNNQLAALYSRLGARNRAHAVALAFRWLDVEPLPDWSRQQGQGT